MEIKKTFVPLCRSIIYSLIKQLKIMRKVVKISKDELQDLLKNLDGSKAVFCSLLTNTDARLKKTNNPYKDVRKVSKIFGMLNFNYQNAVQNQQAREGLEKDFISKERLYGFKNDEYNGCLLYGANEIKLIVKVDRTLKPKFLHEGKLIDKSKIESFIPSVAKSYTQQDIENEVIVRNYNLSNIKKITINKNTYKVVE